MTKLTQLVYISRSTSARSENFAGIEPTVGRILLKSRINNRNVGLTGVLYFGDGCFFQCLEGEEGSVLNLLRKLKDDPRHSDITVLSRKLIAARSFGNWDMKFVAIEEPMTKLLASRGYQRFDPYQFDEQMVESVLHFLGTAVQQRSE
jgi:Sensors of blue-light using FAD